MLECTALDQLPWSGEISIINVSIIFDTKLDNAQQPIYTFWRFIFLNNVSYELKISCRANDAASNLLKICGYCILSAITYFYMLYSNQRMDPNFPSTPRTFVTTLAHAQSTPAGVDGSGISASKTPPTTPKKSGKMLGVRVQMLDDSITIFQVQVCALSYAVWFAIGYARNRHINWLIILLGCCLKCNELDSKFHFSNARIFWIELKSFLEEWSSDNSVKNIRSEKKKQ